jgi:hypothetical protein
MIEAIRNADFCAGAAQLFVALELYRRETTGFGLNFEEIDFAAGDNQQIGRAGSHALTAHDRGLDL